MKIQFINWFIYFCFMSIIDNNNPIKLPDNITPPDNQKQFCCWYFTSCVDDQVIIHKDALPESYRNDSKFFEVHPDYLMWVEGHDPTKSGWHWFHFCSNCGHKYSSDERIKLWDQWWNKEDKNADHKVKIE